MAPNASEPFRQQSWLALHDTLAWRLIVPVPIAIIIAVVSIWLAVPRLVESMATTDAVLADVQIATDLKTIRAYYTENVVNKVVTGGAFQADVDHKGKNGVIPLPATFVHDLSAALKDKDTNINLFSKYPFP